MGSFRISRKTEGRRAKISSMQTKLGLLHTRFSSIRHQKWSRQAIWQRIWQEIDPRNRQGWWVYHFAVHFFSFYSKFPCIFAALKIFLNAETGLCRSLLVKFLSALWTIQTWARSQTSLRLYSSSLLLAYDARVLKYHLLFSRSSSNSLAASPNGSLSPVSMDGSNSGKILNSTYSNWPTQQYNHVNGNCVNGIAGHTSSDSKTGSSIATGETIQLYKQLQRSHSAHNNYDEVSLIHWINYELPAVLTKHPFSSCPIGYERHSQKLRLSIG